jgi:hypothetical protein
MRRSHQDTSASYTLRWPRRKTYQHAADGWIYPASQERECYDPTKEPALPTELARIVRVYGRALRQSPCSPTKEATVIHL